MLDRTDVKKCENCGKDILPTNGAYPPACPFCTTSIMGVEVAPSNTVKVLSRGKELFIDQLQVIQESVLDKDGNQVGIQNYDIRLRVPESRRPNASEDLTRMDKIEVAEEDLYDLEKCVITLEPDEVVSLMNNVALKDIFASRSSEADDFVPSELNAELESAIDDTVNTLMG